MSSSQTITISDEQIEHLVHLATLALAFAIDAMTYMNADAHDRALKIIFPRIGELGTTDKILGMLGSGH
jgi:hypothetical protein